MARLDLLPPGHRPTFIGSDPDQPLTLTVTNLPAGKWNLYLYSHDGRFGVIAGTNSSGFRTNQDWPTPSQPVWQEGLQYSLFTSVTVSPGDPLTITVLPGMFGQSIISGLQISSSWSPSLDTDSGGLSDLTEHLLGLNPNLADTNPQARLASWHFNTPDWIGNQGQTPLVNSNLAGGFVPGLEGAAVDLDSTNNSKRLAYRLVEATGRTNLDLACGAVRLWFKPAWSSAANGGAGPAASARLLNAGTRNVFATVGAWDRRSARPATASP